MKFRKLTSKLATKKRGLRRSHNRKGLRYFFKIIISFIQMPRNATKPHDHLCALKDASNKPKLLPRLYHRAKQSHYDTWHRVTCHQNGHFSTHISQKHGTCSALNPLLYTHAFLRNTCTRPCILRSTQHSAPFLYILPDVPASSCRLRQSVKSYRCAILRLWCETCQDCEPRSRNTSPADFPYWCTEDLFGNSFFAHSIKSHDGSAMDNCPMANS